MPKAYPKAPITEAVLDIRLEFVNEPSLHALRQVGVAAGPEYKEWKDLQEVSGSIVIGPVSSASTNQRHTGFLIKDPEEARVFKPHMGGFSLSKLTPYKDWDDLRDEAKRLWRLYSNAVGEARFTRLALRYINRLELPRPIDDFEDYLNLVPKLPSELPQGLSDYFMQLKVPTEDNNGLWTINEVLLPESAEQFVAVLLDIDVIRLNNVPQSEEAVWAAFEVLRTEKNQVFEACITDSTRELFY